MADKSHLAEHQGGAGELAELGVHLGHLLERGHLGYTCSWRKLRVPRRQRKSRTISEHGRSRLVVEQARVSCQHTVPERQLS